MAQYDMIVIGAGPAGMTAAIYARRAGKSVLVLEANAPGGQIVTTPEIENYPAAPHISGMEFADRLYAQAEALGAEFQFEKAVGITAGAEKTVATEEGTYTAGAVIIATGSENRKLGLPREEELTGRGVSYCASCDGAFFRGKPVAVVGGGNTALEDALYLADIAEKVYLIHRRDTFRGDAATVELLKARENVEFLLGCQVAELFAEKRLEGIAVTAGNGDTRRLDVRGLFVAVGRIPENENFRAVIDLDDAGYAAAGEDCRTRTPGVFVAGDNRTKSLRQLVTAAADGAAAATAAVSYLNAN